MRAPRLVRSDDGDLCVTFSRRRATAEDPVPCFPVGVLAFFAGVAIVSLIAWAVGV